MIEVHLRAIPLLLLSAPLALGQPVPGNRLTGAYPPRAQFKLIAGDLAAARALIDRNTPAEGKSPAKSELSQRHEELMTLLQCELSERRINAETIVSASMRRLQAALRESSSSVQEAAAWTSFSHDIDKAAQTILNSKTKGPDTQIDELMIKAAQAEAASGLKQAMDRQRKNETWSELLKRRALGLVGQIDKAGKLYASGSNGGSPEGVSALGRGLWLVVAELTEAQGDDKQRQKCLKTALEYAEWHRKLISEAEFVDPVQLLLAEDAVMDIEQRILETSFSDDATPLPVSIE